MFDEGEEPCGTDPPFRMPVFVVTHHAREPLVREGGTTFTFVTDGLQSAVEQAKAAAGGREVEIGGGADVIQQCLVAGLLDELVLHVVPLFLGRGTRLFDRPELAGVRLERTEVIESPSGTTHLRLAVRREE
jgi:dihydrofolate reductase